MKVINESFVCTSCKRLVEPAEKTCRNHCPYCFMSLHVDGEVPGDRASACSGIMRPVEFDFHMTGDSRLLFICEKCGKRHWNKVASDDDIERIHLYPIESF